MFFWNSLAFFMIDGCWQFDLWFLCLSKTSLNIWKFTVPVLLKPGLENFEHYFTSVWEECNCVVVWAFFGIAFLWDWNENCPFPVLWPLLHFPNLQAYCCGLDQICNISELCLYCYWLWRCNTACVKTEIWILVSQ